MAAYRSVYLSRENLEKLHELIEGVFFDDDEDFNLELESAVTVEIKIFENFIRKRVNKICVYHYLLSFLRIALRLWPMSTNTLISKKVRISIYQDHKK